MMKVRRINFSPDEWLGGTRGLSLEQEGLYIRLCALMYSIGGPLPADRGHLSQLCHCDPRKLSRVLDSLIALGKVTNFAETLTILRCEVELMSARSRADISRKNVANRWKNKENDHTNAIASGNANHQPLTIKEEDNPPDAPIGAYPPPAGGAGPSPHPSLEKSDARRRGTRLAQDWQPDEQDRGYAFAKGLNPDEVAEIFRDYWHAKAGPGAVKLDWHATWRVWCTRSAKANGAERPGGNRYDPPSEVRAAVRAALRFERAGKS
jgi:uncharacterized protein YdaU (DUF1376 family)